MTCQRCGHTIDGHCIMGILKQTHCNECEAFLRAVNTAALYNNQDILEGTTCKLAL